MRRLLYPAFLFCLLVVLPRAGAAQPRAEARLSAALLQENGQIDLSEVLWGYHAGDDPAWADPAYDDAGWQRIRPVVALDSLPEGTWTGIGWFRLPLVVDTMLRNTTLALTLDHLGASEIYLDGKLVHRFGTVGRSAAEEETGYPNYLPIGLHLDAQAAHLLAVRYSFQKGEKLFRRYGEFLDFQVGFTMRAATLNERITTYVSDFSVVFGIMGVFFGVLALISFLHFMLFRFFERDRSNLYFSLFTACVCGVILIQTFPVYYRPKIELALIIVLLFNVVASAGIVALLAVLYWLAYERLPRRLWVLAAIGALVVLAGIVLQEEKIIFPFWVLVFLEALRMVGRAIWNRKDGAWIIGLGVLGFVLAVFIDGISAPPRSDVVAPSSKEYLIALGIYLAMPVAMSVFLARRFAHTNRHLEAQLVQVQQLSEKTLAQELEKKRLIEGQKEQLEAEVTERTLELRQSLEHLQATQAQLVQQEKLASLGSLAAGIAHEIKNPLNFVNNFAALSTDLAQDLREELEARRGRPAEEALDAVEGLLEDLQGNAAKIVEHGRRADGIVKSMLLHSRGSSGRREPTDLNALLEEYVHLIQHGMRAQHPHLDVRIERAYDPAVGRLEVMPQEMGRVFVNLLNNAFYAVQQKALALDGVYVPTVSITTQRQGDEVAVRIQDNGTGIDAAIRDKIFEPFFTTKPTGTGTGLGLSISHGIVTQGHGGRLQVESEEGQFTAFTILLQAVPGAPLEAVPS